MLVFVVMIIGSGAKWVGARPSAMPELTGKIAYAAEDASGHAQIFVIDVASGEITQLTDSEKGINYSPYWSPNGQWIMYIYSPDEWDDDFGWAPQTLMMMGADGSPVIRVTNERIRDLMHQASRWSPDSQYYLFGSLNQGRPPEMYIFHTDDHRLRRLPPALYPNVVTAGGWMTDNRLLLGQKPAGALILSPEGEWEEAILLESVPGDFGINAAGNLILYEVQEEVAGETQKWLWTLDLEHGYRRKLAQLPDEIDFAYSEAALWSPDGKYLVLPLHGSFPRRAGPSGQLNVLELATGNWRPIPDADWHYFDWGPAGALLVYAYALPGEVIEIRVLDVASGEETTLTKGGQPNWQD